MFCIGQHCCPNLLTHEARRVVEYGRGGQPPVDLGAPDGGKSSLEAGRGTKVASKIGSFALFVQVVI
jgi:hypothetical protein